MPFIIFRTELLPDINNKAIEIVSMALDWQTLSKHG